jgi:hypothetical protein
MFKFSKVPWQNLDYSRQGGDSAPLTPRSVVFYGNSIENQDKLRGEWSRIPALTTVIQILPWHFGKLEHRVIGDLALSRSCGL